MLEELDQEQKEQYHQSIKESVKDGSYFKDAFDWYIFRYVNPFCERTILLFIAIFSLFISYHLATTIYNSLPLVEKAPVIVDAKDQSLYFPIIKKLKDSKDLKSIDEAVAKYLVVNYLKEREEYDFRKANIEDVNKKFIHIKNNSSVLEYQNFQNFMSKENINSPIHNFGSNIFRKITIESFNFKRPATDDFIDKAKEFVSFNVPKEAEVRYRAIMVVNGKPVSEKYLTQVSFTFGGVDNSAKRLNFSITGYKTYKIK